ncbi:hypothetical protein [Kushneria aurantia]|uniref:Uncharacterized protein n=1 Tax=Kushneria aurantia TaxID=504092 RepID=A0ABV6G6N4_9GAMM|nr:hypothetical protein [Kushneria aurantia]
MSNARQIQWDSPGAESVASHDELTQFLHDKPKKGSIITARYREANVRLKVLEREGDDTSIAQVIGIGVTDRKSHDDDRRVDQHEGLSVNETVLVPDDARAWLRYGDD